VCFDVDLPGKLLVRWQDLGRFDVRHVLSIEELLELLTPIFEGLVRDVTVTDAHGIP